MNAPLPGFQQFQMAFGRRCRNPRSARPAGVPRRNMAIYEELLFNNITGFLDACFPLCRELIGDARWRRLNRAFFRDWHSLTPIFREIPDEFVHFLTGTKQPLPAWFRALAHYEWVELAVDTSNAISPQHDPDGDLVLGKPIINPTLMNLEYAWPVHRIAPGYRPGKPRATHLMVFRDPDDKVRFAEINALTARLIKLLMTNEDSGAALIERLAAELPETSAMAVRLHGAGILDELRQQGAILGAHA